MKNKFSLILPSEIYKVNGVLIDNQPHNIELLFNKEYRPYQQHVSFLKKLKYQPASVKIFTSLVMSLFDNRNSDYEEEVKILRKNLMGLVRNNYPFMATGFEYNPEGKEDILIDNYKLPNQKITSLDLVSPDGFITKLKKDEKLLENLLGTKEINKADEAYSWINNTENGLYLLRFNKKPETKQIRVAWFIANSDRFSLLCSGDPYSSNGSLGVRYARSASKNF